MANDLNHFTFTGRLCADASLRQFDTATGPSSVVSFGLIVNECAPKEPTKSKGRLFNMSMFGKRGESVLQYLTKGRQVAANGRITVDEWQGNDGQPKSAVKFIVDDLVLLAPGKDGRQQTQSEPPASDGVPPESDDIPF